MSTPTEVVRDYAIDGADNICADIARAEQTCKQLIEERAYGNGVRGAMVQLRAKLEDAQEIVQRLRKAIHDDFGSPEASHNSKEAV